ncbi:pyridoxal phosphate-dependent aminotransferase [Verminephrobacter aporrectodeae]|uniref:pyridoxal phosphate-dependent aminotransferase n=1 Tax=Verminephrobacter aporrectodeae TaxID=1110389 RepID=UPI0004981600|nr:pyridoxal phosphate-dependent aminotransferase [Verminephrobacter aporrectodeae]MCW5223116.1 pyridoxal phosphate-dependent aminotransferase [Verminephrobacter aporrectodeae subsp. tuberculatae]MCW5256666.1 pyridoxal phosphate-dependent aminotransferase [Verminephrobacter aporrectodeae subsp. tuberculatae]MCW5288580.1 pyridoxal phosphate-dependent aminotransferase [Verminephrobacter aporrectodeae subsp. tuberculatae]MCW8176630.1 pyridoxal phosphate-dependent aminotransferase [Verminephrobacte
MKFSKRAERIEPFYVLEMAKAAQALARETAGQGGAPMIFLNIGEPDFSAPPLVQEAAVRAVRDGATRYGDALGQEALRERISGWYQSRFGVRVPASRIVVTAGASAALQLACLALIDPGDEILMPDPSYPCNRHFVGAAEGRAVLLPTTAAQRYQLSADTVRAAWTEKTRGVLLASPSNPTGSSIAPDALRRIQDVVRAHAGTTLVDEIYLGLSYEEAFSRSALSVDDDIISINSFSKYFGMTGWRLGWMVLPEALVPVVERLVQNLFICASSLSQHAALACFEPESIAEYERRRAQFKARRDYFIAALQSIGFEVPVIPDGAFYVWADCRHVAHRLGVTGSWDFAFELMRRAHVAVTPGRDFGTAQTQHFIRFSTAQSMAQLEEAAARLRALLA